MAFLNPVFKCKFLIFNVLAHYFLSKQIKINDAKWQHYFNTI